MTYVLIRKAKVSIIKLGTRGYTISSRLKKSDSINSSERRYEVEGTKNQNIQKKYIHPN